MGGGTVSRDGEFGFEDVEFKVSLGHLGGKCLVGTWKYS